MLLAAYRDTGYDILLLLHIISVIIAMAGAVAHPLMFELEKRRADADVPALAQRILVPSRIYSISFALAGLIGFGLVSMSDKLISWGDTWLWLSIVLWVAANGVLHAVILPAERAVAGGDASAVSKIDTAGKIATVLIVVVLYLMVFKPGGGGL